MEYGFKGKIALVTGTASQTGMGNAICLTLAKEGCDIVSADIDLDGAQKTADAIKILGRKAIAVKVNITKGSEVDEMVNTALKKFGKIDILVNTAGLSAMSGVPFLESKQEAWEKDLAVNLYGTMNCVKAVIPGMVEHKYGKIINFSSIVAKIGVDLTSYAAAKAGVSAFTRGLAVQYGPSGINVNAIAPGMVKTSFFAKWEEKPLDQLFAGVASMTPLRRNQTVEDIANAVAFLASDVSKNITGQVLHVDSGMVML
jgi:NAD(P)-dependent dehydrogenase (short-subunit alcohol dehydrogenase family)